MQSGHIQICLGEIFFLSSHLSIYLSISLFILMSSEIRLIDFEPEVAAILLSILHPHLAKVSVDVLPAVPVELCTADLLCEAGDSDDVGGLQVLHEEVAARLGHVLKLEPCQEQKQSWKGPTRQQ